MRPGAARGPLPDAAFPHVARPYLAPLHVTPLLAALLLAALAGCGPRPDPTRLDAIAERYVKLGLALGRHDPGEVDAYYGPPEWKTATDSAAPVPFATIARQADSLAVEAGRVALGDADQLTHQRQRFLARQLRAVASRARILGGQKLSFDEESRALYDVVAPRYGDSTFQRILDTLDRRLPGRGPLAARWERYHRRFEIPADKVDTVFRVALAECRARTAKHLTLPPGESFTIEYVKDAPWGGYNWYQGAYRSVIQVNVGLPIYIDRAVDLAAHEGYPGHHVYNSLLERALVNERGWREFSLYLLFAPQSLMAEGTASYAVDVAFDREQLRRFEREVLFPLAGLDTSEARRYRDALDLLERLKGVSVTGARRYLDGEVGRDSTIRWLVRYELTTPERAERSVRFAEKYRSYLVNYSLGTDLVRAWVEPQAGGDPEKRWKVFEGLLASPRLPEDLKARAR